MAQKMALAQETAGCRSSTSYNRNNGDDEISDHSSSLVKERRNEEGTARHRTGSESEEDDDNEYPFSVPAAVVGSLAGFFMGGPVLAVAGGIGAAYASTTDDAVGQIKRDAEGAAQYIGDKAVEFDDKHHFVDHTKENLDEAWTKICEYDEKHKTSEEVQKFFSNAMRRAEEWEQKNGFVENIFLSVADRATSVGESFREAATTTKDVTKGITSPLRRTQT